MGTMTPNYRELGKTNSVKDAPNNKEDKYYEFIPNHMQDVAPDMLIVRKYLDVRSKDRDSWNRHKLLDVGSGIGNIIALGNALNFYSRGVEYDKSYRDRSSYRVQGVTEYLDAFDYKEYGEYDVIYFYQPIASGKLMNKLLNVIDSQIKVGTIIMAYDAHHETRGHVQKLWKPLLKIDKYSHHGSKLYIKK